MLWVGVGEVYWREEGYRVLQTSGRLKDSKILYGGNCYLWMLRHSLQGKGLLLWGWYLLRRVVHDPDLSLWGLSILGFVFRVLSMTGSKTKFKSQPISISPDLKSLSLEGHVGNESQLVVIGRINSCKSIRYMSMVQFKKINLLPGSSREAEQLNWRFLEMAIATPLALMEPGAWNGCKDQFEFKIRVWANFRCVPWRKTTSGCSLAKAFDIRQHLTTVNGSAHGNLTLVVYIVES